MSHVSVIGAGFGGLTAVRSLRKKNPDLHITLISTKKEFVYYPSLIWVPTGLREPEDLVLPLDGFLSENRCDFHQGAVTGLKDGGRVVVTDSGEVANDGLIIASGGRYIRKLPGIENAILPCGGVKEATEIRDRLRHMMAGDGGSIAMGFAANPKEQSAVRGGPVFEYLFGIDTYLRRQGCRDKFELTFFSPAPKPGVRMGEKAVTRILKETASRGIATHLGHKMKGFEPGRVLTEGGEVVADLILFMPGLTGPAWVADSGLPLSEGGMIKADAQCRVEGFEKTYVAGDCGSFPGPEWMPKQAHLADLQAHAAVANLLTEFRGGTPTETFRVELICIIDTLDKGTMVYRDPKRNWMVPMWQLGHWSKSLFEGHYLKAFR